MADGFMSPEQRLKELEQLEVRQRRNQILVARAIWIAIGVGGLVLGTVVGFATWQLTNVRQETTVLVEQRRQLQKEIGQLGDQKKKVESLLAGKSSLLLEFSDQQLQAAVTKQFKTAPKTAALVPRIYMQIIDNSDTDRARAIRKALEGAGYLVLGIETVVKVKSLNASDVRFYHKIESEDADKIAGILRKTGETKVNVKYLKQYENDKSARPNHFEVWLAHQNQDLQSGQ